MFKVPWNALPSGRFPCCSPLPSPVIASSIGLMEVQISISQQNHWIHCLLQSAVSHLGVLLLGLLISNAQYLSSTVPHLMHWT